MAARSAAGLRKPDYRLKGYCGVAEAKDDTLETCVSRAICSSLYLMIDDPCYDS